LLRLRSLRTLGGRHQRSEQKAQPALLNGRRRLGFRPLACGLLAAVFISAVPLGAAATGHPAARSTHPPLESEPTQAERAQALPRAKRLGLTDQQAKSIYEGTKRPGLSDHQRPLPQTAQLRRSLLPQLPAARVRVLTWNIHEGTGLQKVAQTIRELQPDLVLLNEVRWTFPGVDAQNQTAFLAAATGFRYAHYRDTTMMGPFGTKGVAILSRYPMTNLWLRRVRLLRPWPGPLGPLKVWSDTTFGTLHATIRIGDLDHDVFSTRFAPMHPRGHPAYDPEHAPGNLAGHLQAIDMVRAIPANHAVIFGGDLNARWKTDWQAGHFFRNSGLTDVRIERPDPEAPVEVNDRTDYIYYRGPYRVAWTRTRAVPGASDHAYVMAELTRR
jgi:endonuclease/exonuclease/phosphatase family metal-dependent hydrolase